MLPARVSCEPGSARGAVREVRKGPDVNDLVGEIAHKLTQMALLDLNSFFLDKLQINRDAPNLHAVGAHLVDHGSPHHERIRNRIIRSANPNRLRPRIFEDRFQAALAAEPGLTVSTKRHNW